MLRLEMLIPMKSCGIGAPGFVASMLNVIEFVTWAKAALPHNQLTQTAANTFHRHAPEL